MMIFTSMDFMLFFGVLLAFYFFVPHKYKWVLLLTAGFFFYGYAGPGYMLLLAIPTVIIYFIGLKLSASDSAPLRKRLLVFGLVSGLAGLFVYKYLDFLGSTVFSIAGLFNDKIEYSPLNLLLPVGISFYTFKLVSYLLDVYNGRLKAEAHLGYFALYVSFFPQILAGPIDRAVNLLPQLKKKVAFDFNRIADGFKLAAWGLFKKLVIADRVAPAVDTVYGNVSGHEGPALIWATILFALQIYCDFSGYSDIAIGLTKVLGFKSMDNFNAPYFSRNIRQFWNKWHISLSTWLRDYLFLPIAYSIMRRIDKAGVKNIKVETVGYVSGMSVTMFLGGLWHGAGWTFVIWGVLHGLYLVFSYTTKKLRKKIAAKTGLKAFPGFHGFLRIFITFSLTTFAWIFFRAQSLEDAFYIVTHLHQGTLHFLRQTAGKLIFELDLSPVAQLAASLGLRPYELSVLCVAVIILAIVDKAGEDGSVREWINGKPAVYRFAAWFFLLMSIVLFGTAGGGEFIYFRF